MIIANLVAEGMDGDDNAVTVLHKNQQMNFAKTSKQKLARELIALIAESSSGL
jgi:phosphopantothenoylcysteine synthetase/decarboxylase